MEIDILATLVENFDRFLDTRLELIMVGVKVVKLSKIFHQNAL